MQYEPTNLCEVGIPLDYFQREVDFVDDSLSGSVTATEQFKVLKGVVLAVAVSVVNCFVWVKLAAKVLFHYVAVFKHVSRRPTAYSRNNDAHVSIFCNSFGRFLIRMVALICQSAKFRSAFGAAQAFLSVNRSSRFSLYGHEFVALNASDLPRAFGESSPNSTTSCGTVKWEFAPLVLVGANSARFHRKRFGAGRALEFCFRFMRADASKIGFVYYFAVSAAKTLAVIARAHVERFLASFAGFADRHDFTLSVESGSLT